MSAVNKVLVVGGGVGGLTAAIALRQQGIEVDLIEINPDHSVYGVGIIQPNNTLRALDRIGLAQRCVALGGPYKSWRIHDESGRFIMAAPYTSDAAPHLPPVIGITRPLLQTVLLDAARGHDADIRLGVQVETFTQTADGVEVRLSDGSRACYDLVVGADGLYSKLRQTLFPDGPSPSFSGESVWRYNFERPAEVEDGVIYYGKTSKVGLTPMSPTTMYMFLVTYEPGNPRMAREDLAPLMRERLAGYTGLVSELRGQVTDSDQVVYKPMEHLLAPAPWYKGRVVLIGDAVHATTPHLAQGAAMAIEDAVLLGELLGRDGAGLEPLLEEFMRRRFARGKYVVESSQQIADWEIEAWQGVVNPAARPGPLLGEATQAMMAAY